MERQGREYGDTRRQIQVVKMRGVRFKDGLHDFAIKTGGIQVYTRLTASEHAPAGEEPPARSGVVELDQMLGGGLDRGTSTLVVGPAGTGKTTICSQYIMAALKRNEPVAAFLFEESRRTFLKRSNGLGIDFGSFLASGLLQLHEVDPSELSPGDFAHRVRHTVERGVRIIMIDSINGYLNGMPSERFLMIHMHELLAYLGHKGVITLLVVAQHGMVGLGMQAPIDVSFLADTVVLLRFFEARGSVCQAISIVKKRRSDHEHTIRQMTIGAGGVRVGEPLRQFEGVLTGVPKFRGEDSRLLNTNDDDPPLLKSKGSRYVSPK
jgi:circadian clock protein KaiC